MTDTFAVPGGPDCMDVLADGKTLLVTSRSRKLTVVDLEQKKVVQQVPVGKSPHGVWTLNRRRAEAVEAGGGGAGRLLPVLPPGRPRRPFATSPST